MTDKVRDKDDTRIALINNNIDYMRADITEIKQSIKELAGVYPTKEELKVVSDKVIALESKSNLWKVISPIASSIVTAVIVFLLIQYLQHH